MTKKFFSLWIAGCLCTSFGLCQLNQFAEIKTSTIDNEPFGIVKLSRRAEHIKIKYFAAKDESGTTVYQRYQRWAVNKNVVAYSSGTYMDNCEAPGTASPIGLCIDQGNIVNRALENDKLDALVIVYASGGLVASDLAEGNLSVTYPGSDRRVKIFNIRGNPTDKTEFIQWAENQEATVFQTHLFIYKNTLKIASNSSNKLQERRFLAVCKSDDGSIVHYIVNLPNPSTLLNGVKRAFKILREAEEVPEVIYMINLDTGCQDVFKINAQIAGSDNRIFRGAQPVSNAVNLLAYYYE